MRILILKIFVGCMLPQSPINDLGLTEEFNLSLEKSENSVLSGERKPCKKYWKSLSEEGPLLKIPGSAKCYFKSLKSLCMNELVVFLANWHLEDRQHAFYQI